VEFVGGSVGQQGASFVVTVVRKCNRVAVQKVVTLECSYSSDSAEELEKSLLRGVFLLL
jgi:hypothetical protein